MRLKNADRLTENADFGKKKSSFQIKKTENQYAYLEKPAHPKRVTVRCGFWSRGIIRPFFLENNQKEVVTVNGDRALLNKFLFTKIEDQDIGNIRFQQVGTTCHTAEATLDVLRPVFEDRIISRRVDVVWPPRSCYLTPLDYYLWGTIKDQCYAGKPETIDALKDNICKATAAIQLHSMKTEI